VAASALLTALSYTCLSTTEWLSARAVGHPVSFATAVKVAVPAYALTNSAGFSPVTGTALRLQLYRRHGLSAGQAASVAMVAGTAVTLSGIVALGICFLIDPAIAADAIHGPNWAATVVALVLITPAGLWFAAFSRRGPKWLGGHHVRGLSWRLRGLGLTAGLGDWLFSGLALLALLQTWSPGILLAFLAAYIAGCLLSAATGVPGGIGVFEAIVLSLTAVVSQVHETAAALLLYRFMYSLLPLSLVGATALVRRLRAPASEPGPPRSTGVGR
jgi:phosphatidylglycerol lysyltransferase